MRFKLNEAVAAVDNLGNELSNEQIQFFKDSKIRDNKGNLMVCYHGTKNPGFTEFNPRDSKSQFGKYKFKHKYNVSYFTASKNTAIGYTDIGIEQDGNVYSCYLNVVNPFVVTNKTTSDIKSWKNIKDDTIRNTQVEKFNSLWNYWNIWVDEDTDYEDINEDLFPFGVELRPSEDYDDCYDLWRFESNTLYGKERIVIPSYTLEEFFDNDMYEEVRDELVGDIDSEEYKDDYFLTIDDIIKWVLYMNEAKHTEFDGIIVPDIMDVGPNGSPFDGDTTDYVVFNPNQIKSISNKQPTDSNNINENDEYVINLGSYDMNEPEHTPTKIIYWYDRFTRCWVTEVFDQDGNSIDSTYSGNKDDRDVAIRDFMCQYGISNVEKFRG